MSDKRMRGRGSVKKRGNVWWIFYYRAGVRYRESSGSERHADAINLLNLRVGDLARGIKVDPRQFRITVDKILEGVLNNYKINKKKSVQNIVGYCENHLLPWFRGRKAATISPSDIEAYSLHRQSEGARNGSINRELSALRYAYSLAFRYGLVHAKPYIPNLKESAPRSGFFERHQFDAALKHLPEYMRPPITMAYITGWRIGEILSREWRHVDFEHGWIRLEPGETKNGEGRGFPFAVAPELETVLKAQRERSDKLGRINPLVFFREDGSRVGYFYREWKRACIKAGIPGKLVHDFRRTAVRNLERAGVSRSVAMKITGHLTESIYRRYAIVSESDITSGVSKLMGTWTDTIGNK